MATPPVIAVMGPTASGKTALAVHLAERFPLDIVSVDSAQVYRRLDIGSAKPDRELLERAPHRLIDIREPWEAYSAADFARDAAEACRESWEAGRIPLLAGGTMLYFRALERGLSPLPEADEVVREALARQLEEGGLEALHEELARVDPEAARRIHRNDPQRILRALEVYRVSGRPMSALHREQAESPLAARWLKLIVCPADRSVLHLRIEERFRQMLDQGLVEEVRGLRADPRIEAGQPAMRSVGYRQVWEHLEGAHDFEELTWRGIYATRQLAKRQITWLRKERDALWLDPEEAGWRGRAVEEVTRFVETLL